MLHQVRQNPTPTLFKPRTAGVVGAAVVAAWLLSACMTGGDANSSAAPASTATERAQKSTPGGLNPSQAQAPTDPSALQRALVSSRAEIDAAKMLACSSHSDCATVGLGARACGGPEQYLAHSLIGADPARLQAALVRYAGLRQRQQAQHGEASICQVLPDPGAYCNRAMQCEVNPARSGASGAMIR
jgi:hypothetical protein